MTVLRFFSGKYWAAWVYPNRVVTRLCNGLEVTGVPPDTPAFRRSAIDLGYLIGCDADVRPDIYWHMVEHDILHSFVAERLDDAPSAALWNQAHDRDAWKKPPPQCVVEEEYRLGAFQAAMNDIPWGVQRLAELGVDYTHVHDARSYIRFPKMTSRWAEGARPDPTLPKGWPS